MVNELQDMLSSLGFQAIEEKPSCKAADPTARMWARKSGVPCMYSWFCLYNSKNRLVVKALTLRVYMKEDKSNYHCCLAFPELTFVSDNMREGHKFADMVRQRLERMFPDQELHFTVESGPWRQPKEEKEALLEPLVIGRGTQQGLHNWLLQLTPEERELLAKSMEDDECQQ